MAFYSGGEQGQCGRCKEKVVEQLEKINEVDLSESGFLQGDTTAYWRLPGKQLMPVRFLTKEKNLQGDTL